MAEWPDEATWAHAFDNKMVYDEPETRAAFVDAVAEAAAEPLLTMTVTDDMLSRTAELDVVRNMLQETRDA